jgi:hypothetical protein
LVFGRTLGRRNEAEKIGFQMLRRGGADLDTVEALSAVKALARLAAVDCRLKRGERLIMKIPAVCS